MHGASWLGTVRDLSAAWDLDSRLAGASFMDKAYRDCLESHVFRMRRNTTRAGRANGRGRIIGLHPLLLRPGRESDRDETFIHECAHVLADLFTGRDCAHGPAWRKTMAALGAVPKTGHEFPYLSREAVARYLWVCTSCGAEFFFITRPRIRIEDRRCGRCGPAGGVLEWRDIARR